ncbi:MAG: tRNA pseudouridine(55) synthase TruB, partial [Bdellovibrionales bacterium]
GEATKISNYILNGDKAYIATVKLGVSTDTWDITGKILEENLSLPPKEFIRDFAQQLEGELDLKVPSYSAIKKDGKKLYEYAREGKEIEEIRRPMNFKKVEILEQSEDELKVFLHCSKGSYIRSWAQTLGEKLEVGACLSGLERVLSAPYKLENAQSLEDVLSDIQAGKDLSCMVPISECLSHWPSIFVDGLEAKLLKNGTVTHSLQNRLRFVDYIKSKDNSLSYEGVKVYSGHSRKLLSTLVRKTPKSYKIAKVFNL